MDRSTVDRSGCCMFVGGTVDRYDIKDNMCKE